MHLRFLLFLSKFLMWGDSAGKSNEYKSCQPSKAQKSSLRLLCLPYLARGLLYVAELEDDGDGEAGDEAGERQRHAHLAQQPERNHEPHLRAIIG